MAGTESGDFLIQAATYLGATAVAVPLFKRLKLGTIPGFLAAGMVLGPYGAKLLHAEEGVFHIAELGVVLFLFVIGLELSLGRLWNLRRNIFGFGFTQMLVTGAIITGGFLVTGFMPTNAAIIGGVALACSSTAFALSLLQERGELNSAYGTRAFSVLLFQDLAVIPLLAAIPFAAGAAGGLEDFRLILLAEIIGGIAIMILVAKFVLNWFFKVVAVSGSREAFTAAALFVVAGMALIADNIGLSMALGAFLAGVLLAESAFRHQIEADVEPFRELLLGLFFIGVGMQLDLSYILSNWPLVIGGTLVLVMLKFVLLVGLGHLFRHPADEGIRTAGVLSQGGEFGLVVFSLGTSVALFSGEQASLLSAIITLSMISTPLVMILVSRLPGHTGRHGEPVSHEDFQQFNGEVLIVGFGRMGQIVSQVLQKANVEMTVIDSDPARIETARKFGSKVYFGDGHNLHLLETAGIERATLIIFSICDRRSQLKETVNALRRKYPKIPIIVRAHDRIHEMELMDAEITHIVRETLESSLDMAGRALEELGRSGTFILDVKEEFRLTDRERLLEQKAGDIYSGKEKMKEPFRAVQPPAPDRDDG